jgi:glycosyltransferase involved in cell wall biosynthesis
MGTYLFLLSWSPEKVGGVNVVVHGLARELQAGGSFRPLIAVASWSPMNLPEQVQGIPTMGLQLHDGYGQGTVASLKSAARLPSDLATLARFVREQNVRIVNPHFVGLGGAAFVLLRRLGLYDGKIALSFHGGDITEIERASSGVRACWRTYMEAVDVVFACSKALGAKVLGLAPKAKLKVVYNGADVETFNVRRTPGTGPKRILHIGKYEHKKAQDVLLSAFQELLDRGVDARLTMIGTCGPKTDEVRRLSAPFGERVRMLTEIPHEQMPEYLADSDLFVLPSRSEPFGIVLVEAGAAGVPVVATRVGGIPELITHERSGVLVEPDDPRGLAVAMARVLMDDELARSLASTWHEEAMQFTWRKTTEHYLEGLGERPGAIPINACAPVGEKT